MSLPHIIVPIFNALEQLESCLDALARTVPSAARILLIDDASTDPRIQPLLRNWVTGNPLVRQLVTHDCNRGFVATVNHGMRLTATDVVLLNSDTEVTRGWLERLACCLAASGSIATATPWSNNGEIVSIPEFCAVNPPPPDADAVALAIAACGVPSYPEIPTAVGFCMAISRKVLRQIGLFDEETFGIGYGEENDFCQLAIQAGYKNVVCDDAYVIHHGGASFGPLGLRPDEHSMQRLLNKHPDYLETVTGFIRADPLASRRREIMACLERAGVGML